VAQATKEPASKEPILPLGLSAFEVPFEGTLGLRVPRWPRKKMWIFDASDHSRANEPESPNV
jgi:hypothetical protein